MPTVADVLRQHGDDYLEQFSDRMPLQHKRVLSLICKCRTGELGHLRYDCGNCRRTHWVGRSCNNRQPGRPGRRWRSVSHLPVTPNRRAHPLTSGSGLTVSERKLASAVGRPTAHQDVCYRALFDCGSQTILKLASGRRFVGTPRMGFFGALHTWGRDVTVYNPHLHFVVPGGGVSKDGSTWMSCPANFLLPEKAASAVFRAKFRDAVRAAGIEQEFLAADAQAWTRPWVMDVEAVGDGRGVLKYLAPYVYRVAISNNRIESMNETHVVYRYTPSGTKQTKRREVSGQEFVRGFLQHVLPPKFHRIRYYGFLNKHSSLSIDYVRMLVCFYLSWCYVLARTTAPEVPPKRPMVCTECGGDLQLVMITDHVGRVLYEHPLPYLDSG